jgi:hypothetical protein
LANEGTCHEGIKPHGMGVSNRTGRSRVVRLR